MKPDTTTPGDLMPDPTLSAIVDTLTDVAANDGDAYPNATAPAVRATRALARDPDASPRVRSVAHLLTPLVRDALRHECTVGGWR